MNRTDPYRSRCAPRPELAERQDPVLWGGEEGPLDAGELAAFERDGFLVMRALLSPEEVAGVAAAAEVLARDPAVRRQERTVVEPGGEAVRSIFQVHQSEGILGELARDPRLRGVARQVLGGEVYIHQSRVNFKPGFEGRKFFWHSDFETWHVEDGMPRMRALSASILLTENRSVNGPLMLIPGSHRRYVRCVGETPEEHYKSSLRAQELGVPDRESLRRLVEDGGIVEATGPAGTVVFFDCNVMHGSAGNMSPLPRHNLFMVFNSEANRLVEPFAGLPPRPTFLAER